MARLRAAPPIRTLGQTEAPAILDVVNAAAEAYRGVIPDDCCPEPYMPAAELAAEMHEMRFLGWDAGVLAGVMASQRVDDATLIRHAYVRPGHQGRGIGSALLERLLGDTGPGPVLVGTWAAASWAIRFYERRGFVLRADGDALLRRFWHIPDRQRELSVVLALAGPREPPPARRSRRQKPFQRRSPVASRKTSLPIRSAVAASPAPTPSTAQTYQRTSVPAGSIGVVGSQ